MAVRELPGSSDDNQSIYQDPANQEREDRIRDALLLVRRLIEDITSVHQKIAEKGNYDHRLETWLRDNIERPVIAGVGAVIFDPLDCSTWRHFREACGQPSGFHDDVRWGQQDKPAG